MNKFKVLLLVFLSFQANGILAQIKLPKLISNGLVLQRNEKVKIWGWAAPNEKIEMTFNTKTYLAQADANGNWEILLPAQKAGGPYERLNMRHYS